MTAETGRKLDGHKLRYDLVPPKAEEALVAALTLGALKYSAEDWRLVEDAPARYYAAMRRHVAAIRRGEAVDPDDGLPHVAGALASLFFLAELDLEKREPVDYAALIKAWLEKRLQSAFYFGLEESVPKPPQKKKAGKRKRV